MNFTQIKLEEILEAMKSFEDIIKTTPLEYNKYLSHKYKSTIYLKREDLQVTGSFKIRGVLNFINNNKLHCIERWVVCASAWNHSQWVALMCRKFKIFWDIFLPINTPSYKVDKTIQYWGDFIKVHQVGSDFDFSYNQAKCFSQNNESVFIHPFDDRDIIVWQSTVWYEIFSDTSITDNIDFIVCPIWWGWLISWIIESAKLFSQSTRILWCEPEWASSMKKSIEEWKVVKLNKIDVFIDWVSVKEVWNYNFNICKNYNLKIELSNLNSLLKTIFDIYEKTNISMELASAMTVDILNNISDKIKWKTIVLIISWWNIDMNKLYSL